MRIEVTRLGAQGKELQWEEPAANFSALVDSSVRSEARFDAPVEVSVRVFPVSGMVEVEGRFETRVALSCSRCTRDFELPLAETFQLTYSRELPEVLDDGGDDDDEEGVEISSEEMGIQLFTGDEIDLRPAVEEQLIMALPFKPLCGEDCRGLCSLCGADLNKGDCGCGSANVNLKFAALKDFKVKKD